jgi:hypothetical protein
MNGPGFLGVCIVISSIILAAAIIYHARFSTPAVGPVGRFFPAGHLLVVDTVTGEIKERQLAP